MAREGRIVSDALERQSIYLAVVDALRELDLPDSRWRPMRTAPRDGTWVEIRYGRWDQQPFIEYAQWITDQSDASFRFWNVSGHGEVTPRAWRPAHPEWNEVDND